MVAPPPRKIAVYPLVGAANPTTMIHVVRQQNDQNAYRATGSDLASEAADRIAGDIALGNDITAETNARIAADNAEATTRANADTAETNARVAADNTLSGEITNEATTRANADTAEANARASGDTAAHWASFNLSGLPTLDPGNGQPWLSGGYIKIGP